MQNFEDNFLEDLLDVLYDSRCCKIGVYEDAWNASLRNSIHKICSFFGREIPAKYLMLGKESDTTSHDPVNHPSYYCQGGIEVLEAVFITCKSL